MGSAASGIGRYVGSAVGCRNKLTIAGLAFLLTMLESVQVKAPRIATGRVWYADSACGGAGGRAGRERQ